MAEKTQISRKTFKKGIMPPVGEIIGDSKGTYRVFYVHYGKFSFNAEGKDIPPIGTYFEWQGKLFESTRIKNNSFTCEFRGFAKNPDEAMIDTTNEKDDYVKVEDIPDEDLVKMDLE